MLGLLLAMVAVYVVTGNQVTDSQSKAAAAKAEADSLQAQAAKQADYVDFAAIADARLNSVAGVAQTRFDWERFMRELSLIMPEGSWIQSADGSVFGDPLDASAAATAAQPLRRLPSPRPASWAACQTRPIPPA